MATPVVAQAATPATTVQADRGDVSGFGVVALSSLPLEATDTYHLIHQGGPYLYKQHGTVFASRKGPLPDCSSRYYHEYTVVTRRSPPGGYPADHHRRRG